MLLRDTCSLRDLFKAMEVINKHYILILHQLKCISICRTNVKETCRHSCLHETASDSLEDIKKPKSRLPMLNFVNLLSSVSTTFHPLPIGSDWSSTTTLQTLQQKFKKSTIVFEKSRFMSNEFVGLVQ